MRVGAGSRVEVHRVPIVRVVRAVREPVLARTRRYQANSFGDATANDGPRLHVWQVAAIDRARPRRVRAYVDRSIHTAGVSIVGILVAARGLVRPISR